MTTRYAPATSALRPEMDPVTFEVLRGALLNATEEMAITIRRAAYSTNIKTRADFSCAFFDTRLACVAQSFAQPAHLVAMATIVPAALREYGQGRLGPGDALFVNDPHRGSSHLNDVTCISPVVVDGRAIGYVANMAHHVDVGGANPASIGLNREIFQEGLILPPTLVVQGGQIDHNVFAFILANLRAPRETSGDLRAQMSANVVGARRIETLLRRHSPDVLAAFCDELIAYTERWTEREIRALPEGTYTAEGFRDDDGYSDEPIRLRASVRIGDGMVALDVTGSDAQRRTSLNCTRTMTTCGIAFVVKSLIDQAVPVNSGFLRRLRVDGPAGLICTAERPAAVYGGWETTLKLTELAWLALHGPLPDRVAASGKGVMLNLGFGGIDPRSGQYYCYMESIGGGGGARPTKDGAEAVQTNIHNTENAPVEEVELNYPVRIERYELIADSGGGGRFRGGLGVRRDFAFPYADCTFTILSDGRRFAPWGLEGGGEGRLAHYIFDPQGKAVELPSKITLEVAKGGCIRIETPGGGGFGDPATRAPVAVAADRRDGKITDQAPNGTGA
ncbi:MAG: hydantoinase B/oxoprolinase family protein [Alphaproteobacteria bacterium]|nr:hydantoinase B/oxoprolinase family protein [Alphaproteobacteria bacterium]